MTTTQQLAQTRKRARERWQQKMDASLSVTVGMGTCGIAAGARDTMRAILDELAKRQIDAHVTTVGCIGQCVKEPLIDIEQAGQPRVTYANVNPSMVPRLIDEHLIEGQPVQEWAVGRLSTS